MGKTVPIRPDVTFACDLEREMIDYLIGRVKIHGEKWGEAPDTAAIVTTSDKGRTVHSFSLKPLAEHDRLGTCASAAALLFSRALDD